MTKKKSETKIVDLKKSDTSGIKQTNSYWRGGKENWKLVGSREEGMAKKKAPG